VYTFDTNAIIYYLDKDPAVVAATAVVTRTTLVTRNVRDFQGIAGLALLPI
jgi:predicted nucleic acid-binding protein